MRRKLVRVATVAILAAATLAYGALEKRVTVQIEGRPKAVRTFATTVGGALARAGVELGSQDRVVPSTDARLRESAVIEVYRAKPITLLIDGTRRKIVVTGLTIDQVLHEIRLRGSLADSVRPSRSARVRPGMTITYQRAVVVSVRYDDKTERVITNARTVGKVVRELGIRLGKRDKLVPAAGTRPRADMQIKILRVGIRQEVREIELPYRTLLRRDRHMEYGTRKVASSGRSGLRRIRYLSKYVNGERVDRQVLKVATVRHPSPRVILIGAGFPGCVCDRGVQTGEGTWYSEADGLSAAHRTLPMGTVVRVENRANGKWVNVVIRDRGPFGGNRIIDLSDEAFRRIASLSTGVIDVRIRW